MKLVTSPAAAQIHAIGIMIQSWMSPAAATTPPSASAVSPGAMSPTNAPVSRNASAPTSAYVHDAQRVRRDRCRSFGKSGSSTTPASTSP